MNFLGHNKTIFAIPQCSECVVPGKIHTHPTEGYWKFQVGGGGLKS